MSAAIAVADLVTKGGELVVRVLKAALSRGGLPVKRGRDIFGSERLTNDLRTGFHTGCEAVAQARQINKMPCLARRAVNAKGQRGVQAEAAGIGAEELLWPLPFRAVGKLQREGARRDQNLKERTAANIGGERGFPAVGPAQGEQVIAPRRGFDLKRKGRGQAGFIADQPRTHGAIGSGLNAKGEGQCQKDQDVSQSGPAGVVIGPSGRFG